MPKKQSFTQELIKMGYNVVGNRVYTSPASGKGVYLGTPSSVSRLNKRITTINNQRNDFLSKKAKKWHQSKAVFSERAFHISTLKEVVAGSADTIKAIKRAVNVRSDYEDYFYDRLEDYREEYIKALSNVYGYYVGIDANGELVVNPIIKAVKDMSPDKFAEEYYSGELDIREFSSEQGVWKSTITSRTYKEYLEDIDDIQ